MKGWTSVMTMRGVLSVTIIVCILIAGCALTPVSVGPENRYVELSVRTDRQHRIVYASLQGGARVDVVTGLVSKGEATRITTIVPANTSEVERIIRTLEWVHRGRAAEAIADRERVRDGTLIEVSFSNGTRPARYELGSYQREMNLIWDGIVNEIEATASVLLAISISEHAVAEMQIASGEFENAVRSQEMSLNALDRWLMVQAKRCGFLYHFRGTYSFNGTTLRFQELPTAEELFELQGATPELVARLLSQVWNDWLGHYATVNVVDNTHIVQFTASFNRERGNDSKSKVGDSAVRVLNTRNVDGT